MVVQLLMMCLTLLIPKWNFLFYAVPMSAFLVIDAVSYVQFCSMRKKLRDFFDDDASRKVCERLYRFCLIKITTSNLGILVMSILIASINMYADGGQGPYEAAFNYGLPVVEYCLAAQIYR